MQRWLPRILGGLNSFKFYVFSYAAILEFASISFPQCDTTETYITAQAKTLTYIVSVCALNGTFFLMSLYIGYFIYTILSSLFLFFAGARPGPSPKSKKPWLSYLGVDRVSCRQIGTTPGREFRLYVLAVLNHIIYAYPQPIRNDLLVETCIFALYIYLKLFMWGVMGSIAFLLFTRCFGGIGKETVRRGIRKSGRDEEVPPTPVTGVCGDERFNERVSPSSLPSSQLSSDSESIFSGGQGGGKPRALQECQRPGIIGDS